MTLDNLYQPVVSYRMPKLKMMTVPELRKYLGVSLATVHNWKRAGMPYYQPVRYGRLYFEKARVDEWIRASGKLASTETGE